MKRPEMTDLEYKQVQVRDGFRCQRCGGQGTEWHHRRSKAVRDEHTHCSCNGILLCGTCHNGGPSSVHAKGFTSRALGLIVARNGRFLPFEQPVLTFQGWRRLDCKGGYVEVEGPDVVPE